MSAISGTRRAMKEMADGTIRVQIDIDPSCRGDFLSLFPNIDMPVALAPLRADFEQAAANEPEKPKGGPLARLAGRLCEDPDFLFWADVGDSEAAAQWIRELCGISSRSMLDHDLRAAAIFHQEIRKPFLAWKEGRK